MNKRNFVLVGLVGLLFVVLPNSVYAHGVGERYDLPIPLTFFMFGGAAVVVLSFVIMGLFTSNLPTSQKYPRYDLLKLRLASNFAKNKLFIEIIKILSVLVFVLVIATAFFGDHNPIENFAPTFIWIIWWVGLGYLTAGLGNIWMLINPWKIIYEWLENTNERETALFRYPKRLSVWPALILLLIFGWLENIYSDAAQPFKMGVLIVLYSAITWAGMISFGKHQWIKCGECFSVLFDLFARFSPTEIQVNDESMCEKCPLDCGVSTEGCVNCGACFEMANWRHKKINLRPYAIALARPEKIQFPVVAFVILALSLVTFDGLTATPVWNTAYQSIYSFVDTFENNIVDSIGLIMLPIIFLLIYMLASWLSKILSKDIDSVSEVASRFVFALIPIVLAYNLAHFLYLLVVPGQLIIPLISDPFGVGWDLFGTANYEINIAVINAKFVWYISVAAIVVGHVIAVYVAHVMAIRKEMSQLLSLRGQYPMLVLMVLYTAVSLWIMAQPIVSEV